MSWDGRFLLLRVHRSTELPGHRVTLGFIVGGTARLFPKESVPRYISTQLIFKKNVLEDQKSLPAPPPSPGGEEWISFWTWRSLCLEKTLTGLEMAAVQDTGGTRCPLHVVPTTVLPLGTPHSKPCSSPPPASGVPVMCLCPSKSQIQEVFCSLCGLCPAPGWFSAGRGECGVMWSGGLLPVLQKMEASVWGGGQRKPPS